jgi:hypothetical protein
MDCEYVHIEDAVVESTRRDINVAINALRRAIDREDREFGGGIGTKLDLIKDELLALT